VVSGFSTVSGSGEHCVANFQELLQFRVFGFCFLEDGDVGVGVLPEFEEIVLGGAGYGGVIFERPDR
jgi:hypothetical protein